MRAGLWETVLKPPYVIWLSLKLAPSVTAQSGYNRSSPYLCSLQESAHGAPLDSLPVLLWFELADFALEIIDAGVIRQLTIVIFHFLADLLSLNSSSAIHILLRGFQLFVGGLKVAHPLLEVLTIGLIHLVLQRLLEQS